MGTRPRGMCSGLLDVVAANQGGATSAGGQWLPHLGGEFDCFVSINVGSETSIKEGVDLKGYLYQNTNT